MKDSQNSLVSLTRDSLLQLERRLRHHFNPVPSPSIKSLYLQPFNIFLAICTASTLKELKQFARHGGPDKQDIVGVGNLAIQWHQEID